MSVDRLGAAFVFSGPSGSGKSTLCRRLLAEIEGLGFSVSCTTRPPRPGEVDGKDYHFMDRSRFLRHVEAGDFLEHAEVYGNWYGTLRTQVEQELLAGRDVLLDIDVQGGLQVRGLRDRAPWDKALVTVFVAPPSLDVLANRLRGRGTESEAVASVRLAAATAELACRQDYEYLLLNGELETAVEDAKAIVRAVRLRQDFLINDRRWQ